MILDTPPGVTPRGRRGRAGARHARSLGRWSSAVTRVGPCTGYCAPPEARRSARRRQHGVLLLQPALSLFLSEGVSLFAPCLKYSPWLARDASDNMRHDSLSPDAGTRPRGGAAREHWRARANLSLSPLIVPVQRTHQGRAPRRPPPPIAARPCPLPLPALSAPSSRRCSESGHPASNRTPRPSAAESLRRVET